MSPDAWVTAAEAADTLHIPRWKVRQWAARGLIMAVWRDRDDPHAPRRYVFGDVIEVDGRRPDTRPGNLREVHRSRPGY